MAIVKFLYKSQFVLDERPVAGSENPVTSNGILQALNEIASNKTTLVQSGYMTDCIAGVDRAFTLTDNGGVIKLGSETKDQTLFIPDGKQSGKNKFTVETIAAGTFVSNMEEIDLSSASDCDVYICYDFIKKKLISLPARTPIVGSLGVIQSIFAQATAPAVTAENDGCYWWDFSENIIKTYSGEWLTRGVKISLPLALGRRINGVTKKILTDFSVSGSCCQVMWLYPKVTFVIPSYRKDADGTLEVIFLETEELTAIDVASNNTELKDNYIYVTENGLIGPKDLQFNYSRGCYVNGEDDVAAARCCMLSLGHINPANLTEPLYIINFTPFTVSTFANTNDIRSVANVAVADALSGAFDNYADKDELGGLIDALTNQLRDASVND